MPGSWEAPLGGAKAAERSPASTVQKAGIPAQSQPLTKHQKTAVPHGNPHPSGHRAAVRAEGAAAAGSPPA